MKKLLLIIVSIALMCEGTMAQCTETDQTKVLLIGDSWANFMGIDQVINTGLEKWGHSNYKYFTNAIIVENGTQTGDFLQPAKLNEIQNQLNANPSVDVVHLSLGGNDVLETWNVNFTPSQTDSLLDSVYARLVTLIDFIKVAKPGVRILWSGYCYPNFEEIINDMAPFQATHPFYGLWQDMGFPTFLELNTILNSYSSTMDSLAASDPQVDFVRATGLMQYTFGQNTPITVPPGGSYPQLTAPLTDGYPDYPSPRNSMRNYIITKDCFHLAPQGYSDFIDYHTRKFYHKVLMDDQYLLSEGGTRDGSASSQGTVSTSLQLGTSGTEEFATILSFNTTAMPDTGVSKAAIFLRRENLTGTNPSGGTLQVKIVSGNFGATADVEAADYGATGNAMDTPCQFGSTIDNGHWIRIELPATLLPYITHTATTQFIISAPALSGGMVTFTGATDPELAPVLNLTYGPAFVSVGEIIDVPADIHVYPNPTSGGLVIDAGNLHISTIEIIDVVGKVVKHTPVEKNMVNISTLTNGTYFLRIISDRGIEIKRIIKK